MLSKPSPAKPGKSLIKTPAYKAWRRIFHCVLNAKSKDHIPGLNIHDPWRNFDLFLNEVGQPPEAGMAFTRLDKSEGFFPDNCAWLSKNDASRINAAYMKSQGTLVGRKGVLVCGSQQEKIEVSNQEDAPDLKAVRRSPALLCEKS